MPKIPDLSVLNLSALTLLGVAVIISYYAGQLARRVKLPALIGYMLLGIVLGPSIFNLLTQDILHHVSFITEIVLGFVAFSIGAELSFSSLRRLGPGIISIILTESFAAFIVVALATYLLTGDLPLALIFGAVAPASAPAGTVAVIQECRAKGTLTKALYAVVGFDDGLAIIIFGFSAAIAKTLLIGEATGNATSILPALVPPLKEIGLSLAVGGIIGVLFSFVVRKMQHQRDILILLFGAVLLATGLSLHWHLSLILTNLVVGMILVNTRRETLVQRVMAPALDLMPLMFILFFCIAGAHLKLSVLPALGVIGIVYVFCRSAGLMGGAWLGATLAGVEGKLKKYVGMGILSQAGVAIGLSLMVKHEFTQLHETFTSQHALNIGTAVLTTITATSIIFEIVGPILTRIALKRAGEIPPEDSKKAPGQT